MSLFPPVSDLKIENKLGKGGFGTVYSGTCTMDGEMGREVAIKELNPRGGKQDGDENEMQLSLFAEFRQEVYIMRLKGLSLFFLL